MKKKDPRVEQELAIIATSPPVPSNGLCVRKGLDPALQQKLKQALLGLERDPNGKVVLEKFGALRFIETTAKDYQPVLDMLRAGTVDTACRRGLAAKVFGHTADYDGAIPRYLTPHDDGLPNRLAINAERLMSLRYGENPTQRAALYVDEEPRGLRDLTQRQGKELSFNNILDLDAAMWTVSLWPSRPACVIIKHTTPCGGRARRGRGV